MSYPTRIYYTDDVDALKQAGTATVFNVYTEAGSGLIRWATGH